MGTKKSSSQHSFAQISRADIQRSTFDRGHGHKTTFDAGYLIPVLVDEALPGDTFNMTMHTFARLSTPLHPFMDNLYLESFFFAVPIRLIWDNWQKFNGEQTDPGDTTSYLVPHADGPSGAGYAVGSVADYMGIPIGVQSIKHNVLHMRAYNLIYSEWFRHQDLQDSPVLVTDDGPDFNTWYPLRKRGKRHDYFTSCLPFPQKGPAVELSFGGSAPVVSDGDGIPLFHIGVTDSDDYRLTAEFGNPENVVWNDGVDVPTDGGAYARWEETKLSADLSSAEGQTINEIRQAFQIQRLYERDARGGTRYTEILRSHFGVSSPDQRLQRPEYLGGGKQRISVTAVPQTSSTDATSPQGNLSAFGVSTGSNHRFVKSFVEHCVIIGLVSVNADLTYQQGLNRMWSRQTRWDFFWPALAHLGEQSVLNKEIYMDQGASNDTQDNTVWGYQERFAEYRYKPSMVTGQMRSEAPTSLDVWHVAQDFPSLPPLNASFIEEDPPIDRVVATPSEPHFLFDAYFDYKCARPMPTHSVPGMIDHF